MEGLDPYTQEGEHEGLGYLEFKLGFRLFKFIYQLLSVRNYSQSHLASDETNTGDK